MAALLEDDNFKCILVNEKDTILIEFHWNMFPGVLIDNKPVLVQVMAGHRTGDKPLPKPIQIQFLDAWIRH